MTHAPRFACFPPDPRRLQPPWEFLLLGAARGEEQALAALLAAELEAAPAGAGAGAGAGR